MLKAKFEDLLHYGSLYFKTVEALADYLGTDQLAHDAAEVYIFVKNYRDRNRVVNRSNITQCLFLQDQTVEKAIRYLRKLGLIKAGHNSRHSTTSYILGDYSQLSLSIEDSFDFYNLSNSLNEWYENTKRWDLISLIHTVYSAVGIGLQTNQVTRRKLTRCLCCSCKGCPCGVCNMRLIKKDMQLIDMIKGLYMEDDYVERLNRVWELEKDRNEALHEFNLARAILDEKEEHMDRANEELDEDIIKAVAHIKKNVVEHDHQVKELYNYIVGHQSFQLSILKQSLKAGVTRYVPGRESSDTDF